MNNSEIIGRYYGYPACCVRGYLRGEKNVNNITKLQIKITKQLGEGFMPCHNHCLQINSGKVEAKNLITARICPYPFPQSASYEEAKEYLITELLK